MGSRLSTIESLAIVDILNPYFNETMLGFKHKLHRTKTLFNSICSNDVFLHPVGSHAEGLSGLGELFSYKTDGDYIFPVPSVRVSDDERDLRDDQYSNLFLLTDNVTPGYALLYSGYAPLDSGYTLLYSLNHLDTNCVLHKMHNCGYSVYQEVEGKIIVSSSQFRENQLYEMFDPISFSMITDTNRFGRITMRHVQGPSCALDVSWHPFRSDTDETTNIDKIDAVGCVYCKSWPRVAQEWISRMRKGKWPTKELRQKLTDKGCHVVPVSYSGSATEHHEWRISFATAECELVRSFNYIQFMCYAVLKVLGHFILKPKTNDIISSYILKTSLFWSIESTPAECWIPEKLLDCIKTCLKWILNCAKKDFYPNYFIPSADILHGKCNCTDRMNIIQVIEDLLQNLWARIYSCLQSEIEKLENTSTQLPTDILTFIFSISISKFCNGLSSLVFIDLPETKGTLLDVLHSLNGLQQKFEQVYKHESDVYTEVFKTASMMLQCKIVTILFCLFRNYKLDHNTICKLLSLQQGLNKNDLGMSERVQFANLFYFKGDIVNANMLLSDVINVLESGSYIRIEYPTDSHTDDNLYMNSIFRNFLNASQGFSQPICDILFLAHEKHLLPMAIQLEIELTGNGCVFELDPMVFACYLQFLCFWKVNDENGQVRAMRNLEQIVNIPSVLAINKQRALTFLGDCYGRRKNISSAFQSFWQAERVCVKEGTSKWHMAILLSKLFKH